MTDQDTTIHLREVARARSRPAEVDPAEPTPAHEKAGERPPEAAAKPQDTGIGGYRRRVLFVLSSIALALALYWASGYFFAYTDDAYVTSDLVSVAPYVSGRIVSINIVDNQTVEKGQLLAAIDSTPFQLALNEK
jgi:multidrug efflux system membrane fusion protein